jgi:hypothetical protein
MVRVVCIQLSWIEFVYYYFSQSFESFESFGFSENQRKYK